MAKSHANRGMTLEKLIDETNEVYKNQGIADVRKVPTPIKIIRYNKGSVTGFPYKGEWVDYVGISQFGILAFDAKETSSDTSFPLSNIHEHQYEFLESWNEYGAKAFLIIHFTGLDEYYYLPFESLEWAYNRMNNGGRKSINIKEFEDYAYRIYKVDKILDYLNKV